MNLSRISAKGSKARVANAWRYATKTNGFIPLAIAVLEKRAIPAYANCTNIMAKYGFFSPNIFTISNDFAISLYICEKKRTSEFRSCGCMKWQTLHSTIYRFKHSAIVTNFKKSEKISGKKNKWNVVPWYISFMMKYESDTTC